MNNDTKKLGAEKIKFPPNPDGHTDIQTDIQSYRKTDGHLLLQRSFATKNLPQQLEKLR